MDLSRRAALRATLFGLHVSAVFAGTECVVIWAAFRWTPAAIVGGLAYVMGGVLTLLAYPRTFARTRRVILARGLRVYVYAMALMTVGALLGARAHTAPSSAGSMRWGRRQSSPRTKARRRGSSAPQVTPRRQLGRLTEVARVAQGERAPGPTANRGRAYCAYCARGPAGLADNRELPILTHDRGARSRSWLPPRCHAKRSSCAVEGRRVPSDGK